MKYLSMALAVASLVFAYPAVLQAGSAEVHEHEQVGGPKGGRLLEGTEPQAEFFVENDRSVTVTFYDKAMDPVSIAEQKVVVIADNVGSKTNLELVKKGDVLASQGVLPDAENLNLVIQFKKDAESKPKNFRLAYDGKMCGECKRAEYACICGH